MSTLQRVCNSVTLIRKFQIIISFLLSLVMTLCFSVSSVLIQRFNAILLHDSFVNGDEE